MEMNTSSVVTSETSSSDHGKIYGIKITDLLKYTSNRKADETEKKEEKIVDNRVKNVDITVLRRKIMERYPDSTLAKVLKAEPDIMSMEEFISRVPTYLRLSRE